LDLIMKNHIDRATDDPRWEKATLEESKKIIQEYKENAWWDDYDEWAHSEMDDPHEEE
jgi:hypothetical protein